jgi:hypothetical protein
MKHKIVKIFAVIALLLIIPSIVNISCKKDADDKGAPPTLRLKTDSGYVHSDTVILIGKTFKVGLIATKGDANITNFEIKIATDTTETYLDSGLNSSGFIIDKYLTKGVSTLEVWTFIIRDKNGNATSISLKIKADPNSVYGPVMTIPSIIMGAQHDTTVGSFADLKNDKVHTLAQAFTIQDSIEMCYYYDFLQGEDYEIASPNANIDASVYTGPYALANWTIKNETRYLKTTLTEAMFDGVTNDSLLIATYNVPLSKRKAKNLVASDIYSFKTITGKFGLFRVLNVTGTDAGTVEIMVKMQPY